MTTIKQTEPYNGDESRFSALARLNASVNQVVDGLSRLEKHMETLTKATIQTRQMSEEDAADFRRLFQGVQQITAPNRYQIGPSRAGKRKA